MNIFVYIFVYILVVHIQFLNYDNFYDSSKLKIKPETKLSRMFMLCLLS